MDETTIDREAMGQLANALTFICGADHPTTIALKAAAESGTERDMSVACAMLSRGQTTNNDSFLRRAH